MKAMMSAPEVQLAALWAAFAVGAAAAMLTSPARPTGLDVVDQLWVGAFTVAVAFFAGYGRRWTWFLPAGAGAAFAADNVALACAGVSILLALLSVLFDLRSRWFAALVVGLGMAALLNAGSVGFHGANSLLALVAVVPVVWSGHRLASRSVRRLVRRVLLWASMATFVVVAGAAVGVMLVAGDLLDGARLIDQGIDAARDADSTRTQDLMADASQHLQSAESTLNSWFVQPAHGLPFVGPNLQAVSRMARDTADATAASQTAAATADLDNLRFEDGRLDPRRVEAMSVSLDNVLSSAHTAQETMEDVRSPWLVDPLQTRIEQLAADLDGNLPDLEQARAAVDVAPALLGGDDDRRYLVLFTTPVEARGRTGFPGNYAELTFEDGQMRMPEFGRIRDLEDGGDPANREVTGQDEFMTRYGRFRPDTTWRNITMSPDFPTVADVAMQLYPQSGFDREVDGVLSVDPSGLAALMHFTGPVEVEGHAEQLTAENVERFLHIDQYLNYEVTDERVDFLGDVAEEVFDRLTEISLPAPSEVIDVLGEATAGNHIQFTTDDPAEAAYFNEIGIDGALAPAAGDALAVTTTNIGPNKIDAFLGRQLVYDVTWDPTTGEVEGTVTATFRNGAPVESNLPEYIVGNQEPDLPWGYNRSYVSIYSPWALTEARIGGEPASLHPERELDRFAYSTFIDIPPGDEVTVELDLSGRWDVGFFPLALDPAPLVTAEELAVNLTVAGDQPLTVAATDDEWVSDGRTISFLGLLDRPRVVAVALPGADSFIADAADDFHIIEEPAQPEPSQAEPSEDDRSLADS